MLQGRGPGCGSAREERPAAHLLRPGCPGLGTDTVRLWERVRTAPLPEQGREVQAGGASACTQCTHTHLQVKSAPPNPLSPCEGPGWTLCLD